MTEHATDFFSRQDEAKKNTAWLVFLFGLAVLALSLGTYGALWFGFSMSGATLPLIDIGLLVVSFVATGAFIFIGSAWKVSALGGGGSSVAESLGGVEVDPSNSDPLIRRYVNVVEEMSLASGVPVPRIYLLQGEQGINAFAAGYSMNDAAIAVTQGALENFTRDELQAVVAHEYSHILNGDMRLNVRLIGVIHGILLMYLFGRIILRGMRGGGGRKGAGPVLVAGLALVILGYGGVAFGRMIKAAVSRQREYLADSAAVQFTRNPAALAGALKKIGAISYGSALETSKAEEVSHMCFGSVKRRASFFGGLLSTHPPLVKRIKAIEPSFEGDFSKVDMTNQRQIAAREEKWSGSRSTSKARPVMAMAGADGGFEAAGAGMMMAMAASSSNRHSYGGNDWSSKGRELEYHVNADDVVNSVGGVSPEKLTYCASLLEEIPRPLMEARSSILGAIATVYALLLDEDQGERKKQGHLLEQYGDPKVVEEVKHLWGAVAHLDQEFRLPLLDLIFPTLRRMTAPQYKDFAKMVERLIMADGKVILKEFIIQKVLLHRLEMSHAKGASRAVQFSSFSGVQRDIQHLLSCLAYVGHDDINEACRSFEIGRQQLPPKVVERVTFLSHDAWTYPAVDVSLDRLALSSPTIKRAVVDACAHCVMGDGVVTVEEAELLRAICESLDVPLPPFIPEVTRKAA